VSVSSIPSGVIGGVVGILLVSWLATRAVSAARFRNGRYIVEYRLPAKIAGWCCLAVGSFIAYSALHASANQRVLAACVGGVLFFVSLYIFLETQFVRIEFNDTFIYTFSPWRKHRLVPWSTVVDYSYSAVNRWHILKTRGHGCIRLSELLSGLGTMRERWQSVIHSEPSNQSLEPTADRRTERLKEEL
jgi:uncharacterized membrane protein YfcA